MDNVFTIKNGIKLGLGFAIGEAIWYVIDGTVGKLIAPHFDNFIEKVSTKTVDAILPKKENGEYKFQSYRPRTSYPHHVRTETPVGDATDV